MKKLLMVTLISLMTGSVFAQTNSIPDCLAEMKQKYQEQDKDTNAYYDWHSAQYEINYAHQSYINDPTRYLALLNRVTKTVNKNLADVESYGRTDLENFTQVDKMPVIVVSYPTFFEVSDYDSNADDIKAYNQELEKILKVKGVTKLSCRIKTKYHY